MADPYALPPVSAARPSRRWAPYMVALLLAVGLAGCGVSASGSPVDEGDAAAGGTTATDTEIKAPPSPDTAGTADGLVEYFLVAASGELAGASERVKAFLTENARKSSVNQDNPSLTVVRVARPSTGAVVAGRTPVTVNYQVVGKLTDQGRIEELADLTTGGTMVFWVVRDATNLRIDEISGAPAPLIISDQALTNYYRIQPIYFWDQANTSLVPDLRYVPLTITVDKRASRLLSWLVAGPSLWLLGTAQRLPPGTTGDTVVSENGRLVVKLSPQAASGGPDGLRRLIFQLQWSLRTASTSRVALSIDDTIQEVAVGDQEYLQYNISNTFDNRASERYDITAEKVIPGAEGVPLPPVLAAAENANVVFAAIGRSGAVAAFVRTTSNGRRVLQIVQDGVSLRLDAKLPPSSSLGRPAFVPGPGDVLLIATGGQFGRLYRVSTTDGSAADVTPFGLFGVSAVSVAPDGRRIALIAGGQAYVSSLSVVNGTVTVGANPRPILANQLTPAKAVAWTNEAWLYVAGTSGGSPAMWHVTADSVVAENVSESLKGLAVQDLVAYPQGSTGSSADVLAYTESGIIYTYFRQLTPPEQPLRAPFFGTP